MTSFPSQLLRHPFVGARVNGLDLAKVTDQEISQLLAPALETYGAPCRRCQESMKTLGIHSLIVVNIR